MSGRRNGLDWFPFYVRDYLADSKTRRMTEEEHGVYVLLLLAEWEDGPLPTKPEELAALLPSGSLEVLNRCWPRVGLCFIEDRGRLVNPRLERERAEILRRLQASQNGGRLGNEIRWAGHRGATPAIGGRSGGDRGPIGMDRTGQDKTTGLPPSGGLSSASGRGPGPELPEEVVEAPRSSPEAEPIGGSEPRPDPPRPERTKNRPVTIGATSEPLREAEDVCACRDLEPDLPGLPPAAEQPKPAVLSADGLADLWAELLPDLPQPRRPLGRTIRETLKAAGKREAGRDWSATFRQVAASDFLCGRTSSDEPFRAALTWVVGPKNLAKLDGGQYEPRGPRRGPLPKSAHQQRLDDVVEETKRMMIATGEVAEETPALPPAEEETPW